MSWLPDCMCGARATKGGQCETCYSRSLYEGYEERDERTIPTSEELEKRRRAEEEAVIDRWTRAPKRRAA